MFGFFIEVFWEEGKREERKRRRGVVQRGGRNLVAREQMEGGLL